MGQVVEDIIEGLCCSECGVFFEHGHGHPVLCKHCKRDSVLENGLPEAAHKEL